jgi:RNA repair pathway DNA polymerase beta family protein
MKTKTLIKTLHGSHLYGLSTPESDIDYYEVYRFLNQRYRPKRLAHQNIVENIDSFRVEKERYRSFCVKGVPQAVEVLYSNSDAWIEVDAEWPDFAEEVRSQVIDNLPKVLETYKRTALNFWRGDRKKQRHAFRLLLNAEELRMTKTMSPQLTNYQVASLDYFVNNYQAEDKFKDLVWRVFE